MSTESITHIHGLHVDGKPPSSGLHVWLHSCNLQTLQPTVSWLQMQDVFAKKFAALIKTRNTSNEENLALFQLLSWKFMVKYLPDVKVEPCISEPSTEILQDMNKWIKQQLQAVVNELGYNSLFSCDTSSEKASDEIQILRRHMATVAQNNLDLYLLKDEQERKKNQTNNDNRHSNSLLGVVNAVSQLELKQESKKNRKSPEQVACVKQVPCDDDIRPEMCCSQSEAIGEIISSILLKHPRKITHVFSALSGHRLPTSLRRHLWREVFFQSQKHLLKKGNIEHFLRLEFGQTIQKNCQELKIKHATKSPINSLIENAVIETYSKIPSLQNFATDAHLKEVSRVLNVLYVYDKTYQPYLIHWLLALQLTFIIDTKDPVQIGEHVCELAMYLTFARAWCFPTEFQVFTNAKKILDVLKEQDPLLHAKIYQIAETNVLDAPKEVLSRDYLVSKKKQEMEINSYELNHLKTSVRHLKSSDPVFYIYKWIREGFVSVLDTAAMLWVWDQCFLQNWNPKVLCDVSLALILLMRSYFLDATDNSQMKKVFLNHPRQLFTKDIQKALIHIQKKRPLVEVSKINRQHLKSYKRINTPDVPTILEKRDVSRCMTSFILEVVHLRLEFLPNVLQKSDAEVFQLPWIKNPNMDNIIINVRSQFGQTTVATQHCSGPLTKLSTKMDLAGRLTTVLSVNCIFQFQSYNTSKYKSEIQQSGFPYVIVSVNYIEGINNVPLGWAYIPLVEHDSWNHQKWTEIHQQLFLPLHPGDIPIEFCMDETNIHINQINIPEYLLGYNSEIFFNLNIDGQNIMEERKHSC